MEALAPGVCFGLEVYAPERHWDEVAGWLRARGQTHPDGWGFPPAGYVARAADGTGLAAAFLVEPRGFDVAQIHEMVSNPSAAKRAVHQALDAIVRELLAEARARGYRGIWSVAQSWPVTARMQRHGFVALERRVTVIARTL